MKMTPAALIVGTMAVLLTVVGVVIVMPVIYDEGNLRSEIWRERTPVEQQGRQIYIDAGCQYCHSQYVRRVDWGPMAERVAQPGDYYQDRPQLLGTERTGPDLSQAGGHHTNDWHVAHFTNPRYTRPESIMPPFEYLGEHEIDVLTIYVQSLGFTQADDRMQRQRRWHAQARRAYNSGPDANVRWIHENIPEGWRTVPNPYPATEASLMRGERIYQQFCIGCHGPVGDGLGPAYPHINPRPLNFTTLRRAGEQTGIAVSGGILYYQIMNGITGTAMPYFAHELESEKIWDVSNYLMVYFISGVEGGTDGQAINAAHEPLQESDR